MMLTGDPRRWAAEPGMPGVVRMFDPYTYRCPAGHPDPCPVCTGAPHLEEILQYEGPHTVAAVILETVVGTNGIIVPPDGYLQSIREVCDRHGILLICDEVMAGFGRTGEWFSVDNWKVVPDIMSMAKGLTSAYVQLGAVGMRRQIADHFQKNVFYGGLTYNSHPLACAAALATIAVYEEDQLIENARRMGELPLSAEEVGTARAGWSRETPLWYYILREADVREAGAEADYVHCDMEDPQQIRALVDAIDDDGYLHTGDVAEVTEGQECGIVLEGFQEHHVADIIVKELHQVAKDNEQWGAKFKVLKESLEHHIQEEEGEIFPRRLQPAVSAGAAKDPCWSWRSAGP